MELIITDNLTESIISNMVNFVSKQSQYYPKFDEWLRDKLHPRLLNEVYKSVVVIADGCVVGNVIFNEQSNMIEIKNFRIDSEYRNRAVGSVLLSYLRTRSKPIVTDITCSNFSAVKFFVKNGFDIVDMRPLYIESQMEYLIELK